jgi:hypothetical protein
LSIRLNLAIVNTFALILFILARSYSFFSAFMPSIILPNSSLEAFYDADTCSFDKIAVFLSKWSIISCILSLKKGSDQENRSRLLGNENGYSTSLYCFIFILSFSIKITAPLFLYD